MSLPDTLEMDFKNPDVDTSIWLHIWDWNFWEEAVLARLNNLLKTYDEIKIQKIGQFHKSKQIFNLEKCKWQ